MDRDNPLLQRLEALLQQAESITFIVPDDTGYFSIEDELIQRVGQLIADSLELMNGIQAHYESVDSPPGALDDVGGEDDFLKEIGAAISSELAARELSDLAFVTRTQLAESHDALETALKNQYLWIVASHADTGLRRVGKGLITIESAIREYEGLEPIERRWADLADALEIRRLYGQFRRAIARGGEEPEGEELRTQLRSAANRIAILRDLKIYPFLRIYDRIPIRRLQKRILEWLERDDGDPAKNEEGMQLWSDLLSFAELLKQINNREELREHDRRTVTRLVRLLFEAKSMPPQILPGHLEALEQLLGRDDQLDRIVLDPTRHTPEDLREPLLRMRDELSKQPVVMGSVAASEPLFDLD
ncbi:MAG: hypothetical protein AAGC60_18835 [Acidobacteriota bacterium]